LDAFVEQYLKKTKLQPLPNGSKLQRSMSGGGESKLCRYWLDDSTMSLLAKAEEIGYSRSYVLEQAIIAGLATG
jgi:hypothetical protein